MELLKTAALYIRVSTHMQDELSPDAQQRLLTDYAKSNNLIIPEEFVFIEKGISGRKADRRPEFQRMISIAKQKPSPFDVILVWKYSRFARNQEESIVYKSLLRKQCKVDVISVSEPVIDGPFGSLIERIIEWMDEYYSIRLSGEVFRGMSEKALRGGYQARPPLGYRIDRKGEPPVIVPEEAEIVKIIFDKYVNEHTGIFDIARYLNMLGAKTSHGKAFERRSVEYILQNPTYCGMIRWNRTCNDTNEIKDKSEWIITPGQHEAIISKELFDAAQNRFEQEVKPRGARPVSTYKHWLSGVVKCPSCGRTMIAKHMVDKRYGRDYCYFTCYGYTKGKCLAKTTVSSKVLEPEVLDALKDASGNPDIEFEYRKPLRLIDSTEEARLMESLGKVDQKMNRIKEAYRNGVDTLQEYTENKQILMKEKEQIMNKLDELTAAPSKNIASKKLHEQISDVCSIIESNDFSDAQKSEALRSVVEKIVYHKDSKTLDMYYYYG